MKKQIVRVSVVQSAKVVALIYLVTSLPIFLLLMIPAVMGGGLLGGMSVVMLIVMPVLYAAFGFLASIIGAWVYNLVAARVGGFEFTTAEVGAS